jgi:hypothetical protein
MGVTNYTSNVLTFTCDENLSHNECLMGLADYLFKQGFISVNIMYNYAERKNQKSYSIEAIMCKDSNGAILSRSKIPVDAQEKKQDNNPDNQKQITSNTSLEKNDSLENNEKSKCKSFCKKLFKM